MTGSRFFRTIFVEILRPPLLALVPEAGLRISGSDVRGSLQTKSGFIRLLAPGIVTVVQGSFRANCLLYGLEIFVAAAVNGITCVVQCYSNISNHGAGISLHQSLASGPAKEKWIMFVLGLPHSANFNPRGIFVGCSDHFTEECFHRAVHVEGSQRSIIPLSIPTIWKERSGKNETKGTLKGT